MTAQTRSFRLARPACPQCASHNVRVVHSAGNWLRIAINVLTGLFAWPMLAYKYRCIGCQVLFDATGDNEFDADE